MKWFALLPVKKAFRGFWSQTVSFAADGSGSVVVMTALAMPVLIGVTGLGMEASYWYLSQRSMQNAADTAAIAAATNGTANYAAEAKAAAAKYGFVDGINNITIAVSNTAPCPAGGANCYSATVTGYVPLFLSQVIGYRDTVIDGKPQTKLSASAVARLDLMPRQYCVLALGTTGIAFSTNGAPMANLSGCNTMSNADARCNGNNLGADYGDAAGTNSGCGVVQRSNVAKLADPYAYLASNIPPDPCGGVYPQMNASNFGSSKPVGADVPNKVPAGTLTLKAGPNNVCGDMVLLGNVTINTPPEGAVLVIWNGQLYTGKKPNGLTLSTDPDSTLTIVFTGTAGSFTHAPTGDGTLDFNAPKTGTWKGMAIYQDPNLTTGVDMSEAGNSPTWKLSGMVYLPQANVTLSGAISKSSNGESCFGLVVKDLLINGTGAIMAHGSCGEAGLNLPTGTSSTGRGTLVM